jgi:hypothetical protein
MLQFSGLSIDFNKSDNLLSGIPLKNKRLLCQLIQSLEKRDKSHDNSTHLDYADPNRPDVDQHGDKQISLNDVMSFLQVMKSDQSKTEKLLNQLSNKVNDLYDYEDYDEDELLRNDGEGDPSLTIYSREYH